MPTCFKVLSQAYRTYTVSCEPVAKLSPKSVRDTHRLLKATSFLDSIHWLRFENGPHATRGLTAKLVSKEGLLANANWAHDQAAQANISCGAASDKPTQEQIQAIVNKLNGLRLECRYRKTY